MFRLLLRVRSEVEKIVHWMPEILFAAEIVFRGLDGCMPEQRTESAPVRHRDHGTASRRSAAGRAEQYAPSLLSGSRF